MYGVTDAARALLTGPSVKATGGAELLDANDQVIADISDDLGKGGTVEHSNYADVHGECTISLSRELAWGVDRVRLFQTVTDGISAPVRFDLGVFIPTSPDLPIGKTPAARSVKGLDKLFLLQPMVGDSYVIPTGTAYLAAAAQAITDAGVTGLPPLFAGDAQAKVLDEPMVWLDPTEHSWLDIVNGILGKIGYRGLYVDPLGRFRSEPYQSPALRPPEWLFDTTDPRSDIVLLDRTYSQDYLVSTNWWRFIRDGLTVRPTDGNGLYTVDRSGGGALRRKVTRVTAADQQSLVALGDQQIAEETQDTRTLKFSTGPLPVLGHMDVYTYRDGVLGSLKLMTQTHTISLDGDPTQITAEVI